MGTERIEGDDPTTAAADDLEVPEADAESVTGGVTWWQDDDSDPNPEASCKG